MYNQRFQAAASCFFVYVRDFHKCKPVPGRQPIHHLRVQIRQHIACKVNPHQIMDKAHHCIVEPDVVLQQITEPGILQASRIFFHRLFLKQQTGYTRSLKPCVEIINGAVRIYYKVGKQKFKSNDLIPFKCKVVVTMAVRFVTK